MTQAATVFDYASPHAHGRTRLPARSVLTYQRTPDGGLIVLETLTGKGNAIAAIVFAAVSLTLLLLASIAIGAPWPLLLLPFGMALSGVAVMVLIINRTWRRTLLRGTSAGIELSLLSPLSRARLMHWPPGRVHSVMAIYTADERINDQAARGELNLIIAHGPVVRLFTGHAHAEMAWIADCIRMVMVAEPAVE